MTRRRLLALAACLPLWAAPSAHAQPRPAALTARDQTDLARIEAALNAIHALRARFLQVAPDGRTAEGQAWLLRPGRMRFQYDPPSKLLLVAGGGRVVFHDGELDQTSEIPLANTPLGLLLAPDIRLSGDVTVLDFRRLPNQLQVTLTRTAKPEDGTLTLVFADPPLALRSWIVMDAQHQATRVNLFDVRQGGGFDPLLFTYADPQPDAQSGGGRKP